ncbi:hypothetical protein RND81_11G081300 [Saponaria officinalis]|uniref:Uncharacterized protein n=1 Tax=Saponaria officinalis TaxID=3572 RepID=A0AAW1HJ74_SAPOF
MSENPITIPDDYEDVSFLAELDAAEAHAISLSSAKRRRVTLSSSLPPPSSSTASPNSISDLRHEGAYTAALKGSKSLTWQSKITNAAATVTPEFSPRATVGGGACYKCGVEGHWARDCNVSSSVPGAGKEVVKECACGMGSCVVLTANTERNRGRKFFKCPVRQENGGCGFFEWYDESSVANASTQERARDYNISTSASAAGEGSEVTKECACGLGSCLVLTANTERNRGRKFFRCPVRQENGGCGFFEWCGESSGDRAYVQDGALKSGHQQDVYQHPSNNGTTGFTRSWDGYNQGTTFPKTGYGAVPKFETSDNKGYGVRSGSSCFKCGEEGHWARDCPGTSSNTATSIREKSSSDGCYKCGQSGHWAKDCSPSQTTTVRYH